MTANSTQTAQLFPGQGAQHVGMAREVCRASPAARGVFDEAESITGLPLMKLCFTGPEGELSRTDVAQPALFTASAAILAAMSEALGAESPVLTPAAAAGLSLGEYTALYAAGAMDFATTLKLVARRGAAMQAAAESSESGMVAVMGLDEPQARTLCEAAADGEVLTCANFNCPGQVVLSGAKAACARAADKAKEFGAAGAVVLNVAGAFHSEFMRPAAEQLAGALDAADIGRPRFPVIANVDAAPHEADLIRQKLLDQLVSPVRWEQSMKKLLADGLDTFYEIGAGKVLSGLMRRIDRRAEVIGVNSQEAIETLQAQPE